MSNDLYMLTCEHERAGAEVKRIHITFLYFSRLFMIAPDCKTEDVSGSGGSHSSEPLQISKKRAPK